MQRKALNGANATRVFFPVRHASTARDVTAGRSALLERTHMRDALLAALLCGTVRGDDACSSGVCVVAPLVALTGKRCSSAPTSVHLYELHSRGAGTLYLRWYTKRLPHAVPPCI